MDDLYIGLMSGTSIDGVDAALIDLSKQQFKLIGTLYQAYPNSIKQTLSNIIQGKQSALADQAKLDNELAILNANAVNALLKDTRVAPSKITAIGYHGQTIFHQPDGDHPNSLQLGDANVLVAKTGITVVADFRRMDMAVGGQGAPLVPAFHQFLFQNNTQTKSKNIAILNIGGIANLTILPADNTQAITGFDTGPGNCLLDEWIQLEKDQAFDKHGAWASQGQLNKHLLEALLDDNYFSKKPPKSTGREYFHLSWLREKCKQKDIDLTAIPAQDVQSTLASLSAITIARAIAEHAPGTQQVFVCGGGAHNQFLLELLQAQLGEISLATTTALGLDPDWVEASAFGWLAQQRLTKRPANIPSVTGASKLVLLGAIYQE